MRVPLLAALVAPVALAACTTTVTTPVAWSAPPLDPTATRFTVEVLVGLCNDVDGSERDGPADLVVDVTEGAATVTVAISTVDRSTALPFTRTVEFCLMAGVIRRVPVELTEPLGDRSLVDPACTRGMKANGTCTHPA